MSKDCIKNIIKLYFGALVFGHIAIAQDNVKAYVSTDNAGLNRIERIEHIEKYLTSLSQTLSKMESKIDENSLLVKKLDASLETLKAKEIKEIVQSINSEAQEQGQTLDRKSYQEELDLLKADILKLKNSDIQNLNTEIQGINGLIRNLETILKAK